MSKVVPKNQSTTKICVSEKSFEFVAYKSWVTSCVIEKNDWSFSNSPKNWKSLKPSLIRNTKTPIKNCTTRPVIRSNHLIFWKSIIFLKSFIGCTKTQSVRWRLSYLAWVNGQKCCYWNKDYDSNKGYKVVIVPDENQKIEQACD